MASYAADGLLNLAANDVTNRTISVRIHSGAPGNAGTANRIGTHEVDVAAAGWTAAASGASETTADTDFSVLDTANSQTVMAYSLWNGGTFLGWGDVYQAGTTTVGVAVAANEEFKLNAGTVEISFARP